MYKLTNLFIYIESDSQTSDYIYYKEQTIEGAFRLIS